MPVLGTESLANLLENGQFEGVLPFPEPGLKFFRNFLKRAIPFGRIIVPATAATPSPGILAVRIVGNLKSKLKEAGTPRPSQIGG
jgi:hypothetical protein